MLLKEVVMWEVGPMMILILVNNVILFALLVLDLRLLSAQLVLPVIFYLL